MCLMKWLVTGGAGFIGSNIVEHLLGYDYDVIIIDDLSTGNIQNVNRLKNQVSSTTKGKITFYESCFSNETLLNEILPAVDVVIHLAAQVSVISSFKNIHQNNEINIRKFTCLLDKISEFAPRFFMYASSCAVYGQTENLPISEVEPVNPISPYALSKLYNELIVKVYGERLKHTKVQGFRFFNIYGPWQSAESEYSGVIAKWINAIINDEPIIIYGDGSATRDFCYVRNIAVLIHKVVSKDENIVYPVLNIGSGVETSLNTLFSLLLNAAVDCGISYKYKVPSYESERLGEIRHSCSDITRAKNFFGYVPDINIKLVLTKMLRLGQKIGLSETLGY